jgi:hypothetical protein
MKLLVVTRGALSLSLYQQTSWIQRYCSKFNIEGTFYKKLANPAYSTRSRSCASSCSFVESWARSRPTLQYPPVRNPIGPYQ